MKTESSGVAERVKNEIVAAITGTGDIVQATADTVARMLGTTVRDTGKVGTSVTDTVADVASGTVRGAEQVGADSGHAAKGLMIGVLRGTKAVGTDAMETVRRTAHVTIQDTAKVAATLRPRPPVWSMGRSPAPRKWASAPRTPRRRRPMGP
jgi:hypothetical protein